METAAEQMPAEQMPAELVAVLAQKGPKRVKRCADCGCIIEVRNLCYIESRVRKQQRLRPLSL